MDYQKIYSQIIERAQRRQLEGYVEKHHLVPKCLGGSNSKDNIVELTAREHFICHMLLCEIYPNSNKLKYALYLMNIGKRKHKDANYQISSRTYERLKFEHSLFMSGNKNNLNNKHTEETKRKIGEANKKPKSEEHKQKIANNITRNKNISISRQKPILQYDLNGNFIQEWPSGKIASEQLNIDKGNITSCCKGKQKTAYKFIWKYK